MTWAGKQVSVNPPHPRGRPAPNNGSLESLGNWLLPSARPSMLLVSDGAGNAC